MEVDASHEFDIGNINMNEKGRILSMKDFELLKMLGQGSFGKVCGGSVVPFLSCARCLHCIPRACHAYANILCEMHLLSRMGVNHACTLSPFGFFFFSSRCSWFAKSEEVMTGNCTR